MYGYTGHVCFHTVRNGDDGSVKSPQLVGAKSRLYSEKNKQEMALGSPNGELQALSVRGQRPLSQSLSYNRTVPFHALNNTHKVLMCVL